MLLAPILEYEANMEIIVHTQDLLEKTQIPDFSNERTCTASGATHGIDLRPIYVSWHLVPNNQELRSFER